jgi:hypothetical protein
VKAMAKKYYAIRVGKRTGVFMTNEQMSKPTLMVLKMLNIKGLQRKVRQNIISIPIKPKVVVTKCLMF